MADEHKEQLHKQGIPYSFHNWAKSYLEKGGLSTDQVDISANYDSNLSYEENKQNFSQNYPVESIEVRKGLFSSRMQKSMEKETDRQLVREELEHHEKEFEENPNYNVMGRLHGARKRAKDLGIAEVYEEPEISSDLEMKASDLGIAEIGTVRNTKHRSSIRDVLYNSAERAGKFTNKLVEVGEELQPVITKIGNAHAKYKEYRSKARKEHLINLEYKQKELSHQSAIAQSQASIQKIRNSMVQRRPSLFTSESRGSSFGSSGSSVWGMGKADIPAGFRNSNAGLPIGLGGQPPQQSVQKERTIVVNGRQYTYLANVKPRARSNIGIPLAFRNDSQNSIWGGGKKSRSWWD